MKKPIFALILMAFFSSWAPANEMKSNTQSKSKMSGSSTTDHMQAMMDQCMKSNRDEKMCRQQMEICKKDMSAAVCQKIHQQMGLTK